MRIPILWCGPLSDIPTGLRQLRRLTLAAGSALFLSACQTFSPDGGMGLVAGVADRELRKEVTLLHTPEQVASARARVEQLMRRSLTVDGAVQIALLNNRGLQGAYNELGLAEATMVQASLPANPTFSIERIASNTEIEFERRIVANILALATLPARASIAADRFHQAQLRAAEETLRVANDTRRAYYRAVAAREHVFILDHARAVADQANELTKRLGQSGAISKLDQARQQVFAAEVAAQLATARQRALSERERLIRLLGIWGSDLAFKIPDGLPAMPMRPRALPLVEIEAVQKRIDLTIARLELQALSKSYGLTQATRFVNLLEVAGIDRKVKEKETGDITRARGFELEFQIPIFDFGEIRVRQAEQTYMQAVNRLMEMAVNARSQARDAYRVYRSTYDIAAHYRREVLPLRQIISDETLLRYNAMQVDVFALLTEARQRVSSRAAAAEARRDFWLAAVDLGVAVVGGGSGGSAGGEAGRTTSAPEAAEGH